MDDRGNSQGGCKHGSPVCVCVCLCTFDEEVNRGSDVEGKVVIC